MRFGEQLGGTGGQQLVADRATEPLRLCRRPDRLGAGPARTVHRQDDRAQQKAGLVRIGCAASRSMVLRRCRDGERGDRRGASGPEPCKDRTFSTNAAAGLDIVEAGHVGDRGMSGAHLDSERSLSGRRQHDRSHQALGPDRAA